MNKSTLCVIMFLIPFISSFGKVVYVNQLTGSDTYDGTTWAKAYKTLSYANGSTRTTTGDSIWVAGGATYVLSAATANAAANSNSFYQNNKYWFGGFKGNETTLNQRPLLDQDGNGVTEPWEFQYPTVVSITLTDATGIVFGAGDFNGFTLTATATYSSRHNYVYALSVSTKFVNNIVKSCAVTLNMATTANETYYPFFRARGVIDNCLFEKNNVTVNAQNSYCYPFISIENSTTTTIGTKFTNNIVRNNKVKVDYTSSTATSNSAIRGLILNVLPALQTTGLPTTVANCVIHNNDMTYVPSASNVSGATLTNGAAITVSTQSSACVDSIFNCTIANNKVIKIKTGGIYIGYDANSYHYILNNVFYNNQNSSDGSTFTVDNMSGSITSGIGSISNNFTNGGGLTNTAGKIFNQDNTLNTNSPVFKVPTVTIGTTTDNTSELSDWSISSTSYLIGKGTTVSGRRLDKAGNAFQSPRAVGAYEFFQNCAITASTGTTGGTILSGAGNYSYGTSVTVVAKPDAGYHFTGWYEGGLCVSSNTSYTFVAIKNRTLVASFLSNDIALQTGTAYISSYINCDSCKFNLTGSGTSLVVDNNVSISTITVNPGARLTLNSGQTLDLNTLSLKSDATGTATFVDNGTTTVSSSTVQQFLSSGRNWYITTPVTSAPSSSFSSASSIVYYNEPTASWTPINLSDKLVPGRGYISVGTSSSGVITFSGTLNTGNITVPLSRTSGVNKEGFNLVGNPYASYLDWTKVDTATANVIPTIWYRTLNNSSSYVFDTYNGLARIGTSNGSSVVTNLIPPMQSFWVRIKSGFSSGNLMFDNSMRVHSDYITNVLKSKSIESEKMVIRLKINTELINDETIVVFNPQSETYYDAYDSPKMFNNDPQMAELYTMSDSNPVAINCMGSFDESKTLKLGFTNGEARNLNIQLTEMSNFPSNSHLMLIDLTTGNHTDLSIEKNYSFDSKITNSSDRFILYFNSLATDLQNQYDLSKKYRIVTYDNRITCISEESNASIYIYDILGHLIKKGDLSIGANNYFLKDGVYIITVKEVSGNYSTKVIL